jgi:hypothetical protein
MKWHRDMPFDAKVGAAVACRSCGKWSVCFQIETPDAHGSPPFRAAVGIGAG